MTTNDTAKLRKVSKELADLYEQLKWLQRGRNYKTKHDKAIAAIAATMLKLAEDHNRIEFLENENGKQRYTGKCVFRLSGIGRGWRLHESSHSKAVGKVREAIDAARKGDAGE